MTYLYDYVKLGIVFVVSNFIALAVGLLLYVRENSCSLSIKGFGIKVNGELYNMGNPYNIPNAPIIFFLSGLFLLLGVIVFNLIKGSKGYLFIGEKLTIKQIAIGFFLGAVFFFFGNFLEYFFATEKIEFIIRNYNSIEILMLLLGVGVLHPLFEEIMFRNVLIKVFSSFCSENLSIIFSGVLWSLIHLQYDVIPLMFLFFMGIVLGKLRILSGGIYLPLLIHSVNNILSVIV